MKRLTVGGHAVWACGGEDRDGGGDGPAIVLCHGFGAPGDDLVSLSRVVRTERSVRWFFPEAPLSLDFGFGQTGRAWWEIDMERLQRSLALGELEALANESPAGLPAARVHLTLVLDTLGRDFGVSRERTILGGFSQGAMLATELAVHATEPFAGLCALSGALISRERWRAALKETGPKLAVVMTHGRRDPILPFVGAEALASLLRENGADVTFVPHGGAHEIPEVALTALAQFAEARFSGAPVATAG